MKGRIIGFNARDNTITVKMKFVPKKINLFDEIEIKEVE